MSATRPSPTLIDTGQCESEANVSLCMSLCKCGKRGWIEERGLAGSHPPRRYVLAWDYSGLHGVVVLWSDCRLKRTAQGSRRHTAPGQGEAKSIFSNSPSAPSPIPKLSPSIIVRPTIFRKLGEMDLIGDIQGFGVISTANTGDSRVISTPFKPFPQGKQLTLNFDC